MTPENANNPNEQPSVIADYANEMLQIEMQAYERAVRKARNALYWAGGLIFFWEMVAMFRDNEGFDIASFILALIIGGTFVALAVWTKKKPYTAVVTGLAVFIAYLALVVVINGLVYGSEGILKALIGGIIIKVVILVNLILPIKDAKALQEAKKRQF
jgi:hypothetical protein